MSSVYMVKEPRSVPKDAEMLRGGNRPVLLRNMLMPKIWTGNFNHEVVVLESLDFRNFAIGTTLSQNLGNRLRAIGKFRGPEAGPSGPPWDAQGCNF